MNIRSLAKGALIAALYAALTAIMGQFGYGLIQFRPSEALTLLPVLFPEAVPGLFIGCVLANLLGGNGPWDIWLGSSVTLLAAYLTLLTRRTPAVAAVWPILLNALIVPAYLIWLVKVPGMTYTAGVVSIGISEAVSVVILGFPLLKALQRVDWR